MKTTLRRTLDDTAAAMGAFHHALAANGPTARNNSWPILLAITPPVLAAYALTEVGLWTLREIQRQFRIREKRPHAPSLRGTPTPADLLDACAPWSPASASAPVSPTSIPRSTAPSRAASSPAARPSSNPVPEA